MKKKRRRYVKCSVQKKTFFFSLIEIRPIMQQSSPMIRKEWPIPISIEYDDGETVPIFFDELKRIHVTILHKDNDIFTNSKKEKRSTLALPCDHTSVNDGASTAAAMVAHTTNMMDAEKVMNLLKKTSDCYKSDAMKEFC